MRHFNPIVYRRCWDYSLIFANFDSNDLIS